MSNINIRPNIGLGVLLFNNVGHILLGKRKTSHGMESWAPPGGHLEFGESLEECAIREVLEEAGVVITSPKFVGMTNDVFTDDKKHYVSIFFKAFIHEEQVIENCEPHKVEKWCWFSLNELPEGLFLPLHNLLYGTSYGFAREGLTLN